MNLRERLLDSAVELTTSQGWDAVTMAALGHAAGVSRQSVYNEFGSRAGVAQAMVEREVDRFIAVIDAELAAGDSPETSVQRAATAVFDMAQESPLIRSVLTGEAQALLPLVTSEAVISMASQHVAEGVPQADDLAVDAIVRTVLSHVVQPGPSRPDLHELARRLLS